MKYKEVIVSEFQKNTGPYTIYFVYPELGRQERTPDPVVVKGTSEGCKKYVKKHFPFCLYRYSYWKKGKSRGGWRYQGRAIYISEHRPVLGHPGRIEKASRGYSVMMYVKGKMTHMFFKRIPHRSIPIYSEADILGVNNGTD